MNGARWQRQILGVLKWASVAFFVVITVFPLFYMVALSFKDVAALIRSPANPLPTLTELANLENYRVILRPVSEGGKGFLRLIRNSAAVAVSTVIVSVGVATVAAYAAARLRFFGKRIVNWAIIAVYLFPPIVMAIPLFALFSRLGLRGSLFGLVIVYLAQVIPVSLYMLRSYFQTVPAELEEAAMIDGCNRLQVIRKVTLPLAAPAIAAVSLYVFMISWNEFLYALLFLTQDPTKWTLSLGLQQLLGQEVPRTVLMAGSVVISLPIIVIFFAAERFLVEGLTAGGVKG